MSASLVAHSLKSHFIAYPAVHPRLKVPEQVLSLRFLSQEEVVEVEHKLSEAEHSRSQLRGFCTKFCTPAFLEAFVLTFLAGERFQLTHADLL